MTDQVTRETLEVIKFHDTATHLRWFWRDHSVIGQVEVDMRYGAPINPAGALAFVRDAFGPDAHVLW